jgi:cysteine-rich repeat protein
MFAAPVTADTPTPGSLVPARGRLRRERLEIMARSLFLFPAFAAMILVACGGAGGPSPVGSTPTAVCPNGVVESGEECDDGNANNADGCLATCQRPVIWVPSDVHVHSTGCGRYASPEEVAERLEGQGIQVGAALVWGTGFEDDAPLFTGRDHPLSGPGFILHYDMEVSHFAAAKAGHLVLLGLDSLEFSSDVFSTPGSGVPVVDWARRQPRAVVGMAHGQYWPADGSFPVPPGGCCVPWEIVVHAARGRLDFLSMERLPEGQDGPVDEGTFRLWQAAQNAGFRVAIAGGSDWACLTQQFSDGTPRTDVIVDGPLTYESWLQAIKAGRTTAARGGGNHLNLRVEGRRLGDEVSLPGAQEVTVTLETAGAPAEVEVLVNGRPVARVGVAGGLQVTQARVPITGSSWIAARSPYVLTSPVYVRVGGQPIRASADDACYLWRSVADLKDLVVTGRLRLTASRDEALRAYDEAMAELQRRFAESGGQSCP